MCIEDCTLQIANADHASKSTLSILSISARPEGKSCSQLRQNEETAAFGKISALCEVLQVPPHNSAAADCRSGCSIILDCINHSFTDAPESAAPVPSAAETRGHLPVPSIRRTCGAAVRSSRGGTAGRAGGRAAAGIGRRPHQDPPAHSGTEAPPADLEGTPSALSAPAPASCTPLSASFRTRRRARRHPPPHDATIYAGCQVGWPAPAANEASMRLRASLRTVRHGMHRKYPGRISSDFRLGLVRRSPNANLAKASKMAAGRALGNG